MRSVRKLLTSTVAALATSAAFADVNIGVSLSLTGPGSALGIPVQNGLKLSPTTIAGEKINYVILDDGTDPTKGASNASRLVTEHRVDLIIGSSITNVSAAMAQVATQAETVQLATSPVALPTGSDRWVFRLPQSVGVMAYAMVEHMKRQHIRSVGVIGYDNDYGDLWIKEVSQLLKRADIGLVATERFARTDVSVTAQALRLTAANPDAVLVVAAGSVAAMPELAIRERGYKGKVYQTHAAASQDLIRIGGKAMEGTFVVSGPAVVAEQLPDTHPSKKTALEFGEQYDRMFGASTRNQFSAHGYDAILVLRKIIPVALKKARPGTAEFRDALRDALETMGRTVLSQGVLNWTRDDHWGYTNETGVILTVANGKFKVVP
jgi:branched-chain amino acid transport system substrate-binding protein